VLLGLGSVMGVDLQRIAITERDRGLGSRAIALVLPHCFDELGAHRVSMALLAGEWRR
jgi:hypothetical protein